MKKIAACLFDLDGVLVDTARYHFLAWKKLADELGIDFTLEHNELLKGVSRMDSLDIILNIGNLQLSQEKKNALADQKNQVYLEYILQMNEEEILPGVKDFLTALRKLGVGVALGSASKNAPLILERLKIGNLFDAVIDGTKVSKAKPDPEVFLKGAEALAAKPAACIVFEDAIAGIEAARNAGMMAVGVGDPQTLSRANLVISGFRGLTPEHLFQQINEHTTKKRL
ncbi:beta-phosphoglucomutase [Mangrovibacterium marinum]|uniref:Beta-phosphoglucomutase n=1 Tax=Mangrovibacterium marinum TaxID=1639118 RepID=A0A2T5C0R4_9BACT|nr:beta-phosphoglucomutase [Mangrovibacterium marinum]PTN08159.1 beta-phosphoglucomutase [Mangrovibacterium marinum]